MRLEATQCLTMGHRLFKDPYDTCATLSQRKHNEEWDIKRVEYVQSFSNINKQLVIQQ